MLEVRGARADEVDAAIAACAEAFGDTPGEVADIGKFFDAIHKRDPGFLPENSRVALVDGEIVSVVQIFDRQMLIGGVPVRVGGVGSVGTRPAHRGRGYNTAVLRNAVEYMEREGYDLSLLFTGINGFYGRVGWQTFEHVDEMTLHLPTLAPAFPFDGEVRPIRWDEDLDAIAAIHEATNRDATGPTLRTRAFWEAHRIWFPFDPNRFLVAVADGRIVAYVRDNVSEYGYLDGWENAAVALVARAFQNADVSEMSVPRLRPFDDVLSAHGFEIAAVKPVSWFMFRIIRFDSLLSKLLPQMQARWTGAGVGFRSGGLRLRGDFGDATIAFGTEGLSVAAGGSSDATIQLEPSHAEMMDMILGQVSPDALAERAQTDLPRDATRALFATLFPRRDFRWYRYDGF